MDDTIYRQAAIDAVMITPQEWDGMYIQDLNCRLRDALNALPSAQPEPQWIPCSEGTPKKTGYYICTCHDGVRYKTSALKWSTYWVLTGARSYWKVIAWMPLPEPYKAERREE